MPRRGHMQGEARERLATSAKTARVRQYVEGYIRDPETPKQIRAAPASAVRLLLSQPWVRSG